MRHFFASTIAESDVEQETATTAADIVSTSSANVTIVEQPLIEPVVSVAPPTSAHTHVYESADVIDEPVWVLRTTAPSVTASTSTTYVAHSTVLPRTALSATQAKGTAPTAHHTPHMESQYLHPPHTQVVAAETHPPPATFADTSVHTTAHIHTTAPTVQLVEVRPPVPTRLIEVPQARPTITAGTVVPLPTASPYRAHYHPPSTPVTQTVPPPAHSHYTRALVHTYSNLPTSTTSHPYLNVPVLSTATITTSAASRPHVHYDPEHSIVEQALPDPTLASASSTV